MIQNKKIRMSILSLVIIFLASGCSLSVNTGSGSGSTASDGGVFRSADNGNKWAQKVLIPTNSGKPVSIGNVSVNTMAMDPSDPKAIYIGTVSEGLYYSFDNANNWFYPNTAVLEKSTINDIAIDPQNKCIIYIATGNKVKKTEDCTRTWTSVYFDNDLEATVKSIAIDSLNSKNVYIGISRGDVIKSEDRGGSWKAVGRFKKPIAKIIISQNDTRQIFLGTTSNGFFRSLDSGATWEDLSDNIKAIDKSPNFRDLTLSKSTPGYILLATKYGLLRSLDNGITWSNIDLLTPEKNATINSLAVNQVNNKYIYYVTDTTFYRSVDGGQNWTTKKLPGTRSGSKLLLEPKENGLIYLGVKKIQ